MNQEVAAPEQTTDVQIPRRRLLGPDVYRRAVGTHAGVVATRSELREELERRLTTGSSKS